MRWSSAHIPTLREAPQEAEVMSHKLMMRAGMMRRLASGIYSYLPLGWSVIYKVEKIIREEMNRSGAEEVLLPVVQPKEIWEETGRWGLYEKELVRFKDRHERDFCLQPTSEEAICDLVRRDVKSYRQLPLNLYQIQTKFRDEIRPRFGVMRGREFIMKDAYSFDLGEEQAARSYEEMRKAYRRIFIRCGLKFKAVEADTGAIGGSRSEEFTVLADSGEDEIVSCSSCAYGANQDKAKGKVETPQIKNAIPLEIFPTPGIHTIEALGKMLNMPASQLMKTMIAKDKTGHSHGLKCIVVLLRGDHEIHEVKLQSILSSQKKMEGIKLATDADLQAWGLPKGSLGPAKFPHKALVVMDDALSEEASYIGGANQDGFHFRNIVLKRDAQVDVIGTIRRVQTGEKCIHCGGELKILRGIEVGHVFYLGKKYSEAMKLTYVDQNRAEKVMEMGCYGIGVTRTVAASIEQNHDEYGICWPLSLAPFEVGVVSLGQGQPQEEGKKIYEAFLSAGLEVLWDDRDCSPGVKFKDMDLIGIPVQVIVGEKGLKNSEVEFKIRKSNERKMVSLTQIKSEVQETIQKEKEKLLKEALKYL